MLINLIELKFSPSKIIRHLQIYIKYSLYELEVFNPENNIGVIALNLILFTYKL